MGIWRFWRWKEALGSMSRYARGAYQERKLKRELEASGFYVVRSSGSHGRFDLVAISDDKLLLIQLKKRVPPLMNKLRRKVISIQIFSGTVFADAGRFWVRRGECLFCYLGLGCRYHSKGRSAQQAAMVTQQQQSKSCRRRSRNGRCSTHRV